MPLNSQKISKNLTHAAQKFIHNIHVEQSVTSTNDVLLNEAKSNPQKNTALFAEEQTAGRGRLGRTWISPANKNIYFSLSWYFKKQITEIAGLSTTIGKSIAIALKNYGITQPITVKYPNDLMHDHKKFGGVLIETISANTTGCVAVIGVGINVNLNADDINSIDQPWTSLLQITKQRHDRNKLAAAILNALSETLLHH